MKINIDIPDEVHKELKIRAAEGEITLKLLIVRVLKFHIGVENNDS